MGGTRRGRRARRRKMWLVAGGAVLCICGTLAALALTHGLEGLVRFLTVPSVEARSGRKYTPSGAVRRYLEKRSEQKPKDE